MFFAKLKKRTNITEKLLSGVKKLNAKKGAVCAVGYPTNEKGLSTPEPAYYEKASVIQVAIANNYGFDNVPARPFMELASKNMQEGYKNTLKATHKKLISGEAELSKVLDLCGLQAEEAVRKSIMEGDWEPNSPETIAKKGSDRPLVDTGTLRKRVTHVVR